MEIANQTVHGVLHVGWVPDGAGGIPRTDGGSRRPERRTRCRLYGGDRSVSPPDRVPADDARHRSGLAERSATTATSGRRDRARSRRARTGGEQSAARLRDADVRASARRWPRSVDHARAPTTSARWRSGRRRWAAGARCGSCAAADAYCATLAMPDCDGDVRPTGRAHLRRRPIRDRARCRGSGRTGCAAARTFAAAGGAGAVGRWRRSGAAAVVLSARSLSRLVAVWTRVASELRRRSVAPPPSCFGADRGPIAGLIGLVPGGRFSGLTRCGTPSAGGAASAATRRGAGAGASDTGAGAATRRGRRGTQGATGATSAGGRRRIGNDRDQHGPSSPRQAARRALPGRAAATVAAVTSMSILT